MGSRRLGRIGNADLALREHFVGLALAFDSRLVQPVEQQHQVVGVGDLALVVLVDDLLGPYRVDLELIKDQGHILVRPPVLAGKQHDAEAGEEPLPPDGRGLAPAHDRLDLG